MELDGKVCYIRSMFEIMRQAEGSRGAFARLVRLDADDYLVIVRLAEDERLHHRYVGPDWSKAEEVFRQECDKLETSPQGRSSASRS